MNKGIIALLGSGETAPGMTRIHRELLSRLEPKLGATIDTSYGFQENVVEMTQKLVDYFQNSLNLAMKPLSFTSFDDASSVEKELFKQQVRESNYVFAGPGSPSYALKQWSQLGLGSDLEAVLENNGTVIFSSAAALSLGKFAAPIYEIYKAGAEPYWIEALNLLAVAGLNCVVIPHFDNKEGESYDTSCCYLGLKRLELLESQLPVGTATLGIDEHTAVIIDLEQGTLSVQGRANAHWRIGGTEMLLENESITPLAKLQGFSPASVAQKPSAPDKEPESPAELAEAISSGSASASSYLAKLVLMAQTGGEGFIDPSSIVEGILDARVKARSEGNYQLGDDLRDILTRAGIEIKDGANGSSWSITKLN